MFFSLLARALEEKEKETQIGDVQWALPQTFTCLFDMHVCGFLGSSIAGIINDLQGVL